jgi:hypothetical protein
VFLILSALPRQRLTYNIRVHRIWNIPFNPSKKRNLLKNFIRHTWKRNEAGEPQDAFSRRKLDIDWKTAKIRPNGVNMTTMRFPYTQQESSTSNQVERPQAGTKTSRNAITLWYANR